MRNITETLQGLKTEDIGLQLLFLYSTNQISRESFFSQGTTIKEAAAVEPDFFIAAIQGYFLQLKSQQIKKSEQKGATQAMRDAFDLDWNQDAVAAAVDILDLEDTRKMFGSPSSAETELSSDDSKPTFDAETLDLVRQNNAEVTRLRACTMIVTATMSHLRKMRRPTYRQLTPFAPIMRSSLFDTSTDWMLNDTPEHLVKKMNQLDAKHRKTKLRISQMEKLSQEEIGDLLMFGQFLAAINQLTESFTTQRLQKPVD